MNNVFLATTLVVETRTDMVLICLHMETVRRQLDSLAPPTCAVSDPHQLKSQSLWTKKKDFQVKNCRHQPRSKNDPTQSQWKNRARDLQVRKKTEISLLIGFFD